MRIALLDDYQRVALDMADWSPVLASASLDVFTDHLTDVTQLVGRLAAYDAVVLMRERTPMPAELIEQLPKLRLLVTTGMRNAAIDLGAARAAGVTVCGTRSVATAPVELTWALILGLARHVVDEANNVEAGGWQQTVGRDLCGSTLGILGLGRIGSAVARVGQAFGMSVMAWSANLSEGRASQMGVEAVPLPHLLANSDVVTVHQVLSDRTRGLLGRQELSLMKPTALLVNTSRGPIVDTDALIDALRSGSLGGAALDVFDDEPLPADHALRSAPRTLLTPHLGYVTESVYRTFFADVVDDIVAYLQGAPVRILT